MTSLPRRAAAPGQLAIQALVLALILSGHTVAPVRAQAPVPLVASYSMDTVPGDPHSLADAGPFGYNGHIEGATVDPQGHTGQALHFDGDRTRVTIQGQRINDLAAYFTLAFWIRIDRYPKNGAYAISKGPNAGWQIGIGHDGLAFYHGYWGGGWYQGGWLGHIILHQWTHLALVMQKGQRLTIYENGAPIVSEPALFAFRPVGDPLILGGSDWAGSLDDVHLYATALTPTQVQADMAGQLATRRPVDADFPVQGYPVRAALVRFDMPLAFSEFDQRQRQTAVRIPGPDAVDWPNLTLSDGAPLFRDSAEQNLEVPLPTGGKERPLFQQPYDPVIQPVNHWFRAVPWIWGQYYIYTTDPTARTSSGDYELWTFPILISGEGQSPIREVTLKLAGQVIYHRAEALHSLTLLLPANLNGQPYELSVNGRGPVQFNVGLKPTVPGHPEDIPQDVSLYLPGAGPRLHVGNLRHPTTFPDQKAWDADMQSLADGKLNLPDSPPTAPKSGGLMARRLGIEVPRSPETINLVALSAGMSGGEYFGSAQGPAFKGTPEEYAAHLADMGFDRDFEEISPQSLADDTQGRYDAWFQAMAAHGLQAGLNVTGSGSGSMLGNPNLAFYSYNLPGWHRPLYRDYQLVSQRFDIFSNFAGIVTGADNAGYVPYWDWAPPIPNRPWGRAFVRFSEGRPLKVPVGPGIQPQKDYEIRGTQKQFIDYIHRYDATYHQYGYFASAVQAISSKLDFTTGSFGSSPGVGGRGGWPWASIPGQPMEKGVPIQTAYDWNELSSSKPMHNVALIDRLRSGNPLKPTWTIIDDFYWLFGREARQRAYALALTRGVQAVGTNFLANTTVPDGRGQPRAQVIADETSLFAWIHRYGGVYSMTRPQPAIGILFVHDQAISRPVVGGESPPSEQLYRGSHEGKVTEALFLCHAAGWPARIITSEELASAQLSPGASITARLGVKTLLLVGLNPFDNTWAWYDGLKPQLQAFVKAGGVILRDDESVCPVPSVETGMKVAAYVTQSDTDATPLLIERNLENIRRLRQAMKNAAVPVAVSDDPTIWAIPTMAGNTQYVTVVNQGSTPGKSASQVMKPQVGRLAWRTDRPIYDVRLGKRVTAAEASSVDLTKDAFQWYALPAHPVSAPAVTVTAGADGFYHARAAIGQKTPLTGIPIELAIARAGETVVLYTATGLDATLPVRISDPAAHCVVTPTELLTGLAGKPEAFGQRRLDVRPASAAQRPGGELAEFETRKDRALTIALTPGQDADPKLHALADKLARYFKSKGRPAQVMAIQAGSLVVGLQQETPIQHYPQWRTVDSDMVLMGAPASNILLLDQARGRLFFGAPAVALPGCQLFVTHSPFVGECDALDILSATPAGIEQGVGRICGSQ